MRTFMILLSLALIGCGTTKQVGKAIIDEDGYLVGYAQKSDFEKDSFQQWFSENYRDYQLDLATVDQIKPLLKGVKITAIMGAWCGDSRRETPIFYKLLDTANFNYKNLTMIAVDRTKSLPNEESVNLNIERVPTFIFYKDGKEINRFVEYPIETLEKDFLKILQEGGYRHAYFE